MREVEQLLALQVGDEVVDVGDYEGDLRPSFLGEFFRNLVEPLALQKPFPNVGPNGVHTKKLVSLDVENDRAIVITIDRRCAGMAAMVLVSRREHVSCVKGAQFPMFTARTIAREESSVESNPDGSSGWFSDRPGKIATDDE